MTRPTPDQLAELRRKNAIWYYGPSDWFWAEVDALMAERNEALTLAGRRLCDLKMEQADAREWKGHAERLSYKNGILHDVCRTMEQERDKARKALCVPGAWECSACGFVLNKRTLHADTGAVGVNDNDESELCPNDGATMRRVTWEREAERADKSGIEQMVRADQAERITTRLRADIKLTLDDEDEEWASVRKRLRAALDYDGME